MCAQAPPPSVGLAEPAGLRRVCFFGHQNLSWDSSECRLPLHLGCCQADQIPQRAKSPPFLSNFLLTSLLVHSTSRNLLQWAHPNSLVAQSNDIFEWSRDHRVHHKYSETDADPHNARRGFFFSHIGWLFVRKHRDVIEKGRKLDVTDLLADPVVRFQRKLFCPWDTPGKNTGVGCHCPLQGIYPTQRLNPGLRHCRQILYHLSHQGNSCWFRSAELATMRALINRFLAPKTMDLCAKRDDLRMAF
ncbi:hypothetical protein FD755_023077 [Muntiacus reevesi]|uniref:Fatty acid desaturase domain-containing protein n=1 Tax=Muntiacus reevesi TaxID=9886 RepID=A0A5N3VZ35_MUNRE|nr:hypothetical protein FD755_023077 [Muntiacus reevesi]